MLNTLRNWRRPLNLAGFLICAGLLAWAYYLQYVEGMEPCPLCIFQRVAFYGLGAVFLLATVHHPGVTGARVYGGLVVVAAGVGVALAVRHLYLQSLPPDQVPACGPSLDFMLDSFPLMETIRTVLEGSGSCAEVDDWWGVSIPVWTLAGYLGLGLAGALINFAPRRRG